MVWSGFTQEHELRHWVVAREEDLESWVQADFLGGGTTGEAVVDCVQVAGDVNRRGHVEVEGDGYSGDGEVLFVSKCRVGSAGLGPGQERDAVPIQCIRGARDTD